MTLLEVFIIFVITAILVSLPVGGCMRCEAKWEHSGMASKWGFLSGCLVEVEPGRWIPEGRLREIK